MNTAVATLGLAPALKLVGLALVIALLPAAWWWLRQRGSATLRGRLAALTAITLFLTFDLTVFGAFTRLTDSGLGCPDWPGCYGEASPLAADRDIQAAEAAMPTGPVTVTKAWIEMIHRYLAMAVGVLCIAAFAAAWWRRRELPHSPWWATATLAWVIVQGLFGRYTVTLKLYPAIVTLHLLGALVLLGLLVLQHESFADRPMRPAAPRRAIAIVLAVLLVQMVLGAWVSTNYAVLACTGFPACNGQWWPAMDIGHGFTVMRELGRAGHGGFLPFDALVAIHMAHRLFAAVAVIAVLLLVRRLRRSADPGPRRHGLALLCLLGLQLATGLSNVVLDWPLLAALMHNAGAAALVCLLTSLWARSRPLAEGEARDITPAGLGLAA